MAPGELALTKFVVRWSWIVPEVILAYLIAYLIDIPGREFNQLLKPTDQADAGYFEKMNQGLEADLRDGRLLYDDTQFLVDLTGEWTECKLPYSYSRWLYDSENSDVSSKVRKWEQVVKALLPSRNIFRIDDFFLDPWNSRYDYLLVRSPQAVEAFLTWLKTQDNRYWTVINAAQST